MNKVILILLLVLSSVLGSEVSAQNDGVDYLSPKKYTLAGIVVDGVRNFDHAQIINKTGLVRGDEVTIPGDDVAKAINNLWKEKLFSDVQIVAEKIQGNNIFLVIKLKERERLSRYSFKGVSKSEANKIREVLDLYTGKIITEDLLLRVKQSSRNYFIDKGYLKTKVNVVSQPDTLINNSARLTIKVKKGEKIKISKILVEGNEKLSDSRVRRAMKKTKQKRWYFLNIGSKFMQSSFANDKRHVIEKYKELAFRDAEITFDTLYDVDEKSINIKMTIDEGNKYFIRNIDWIGNLKYSSGRLDTILGIKTGDEYNQATLETRLFMNPGGSDVSSLYMDDGYLFFQLTPVETKVTSDSVDLELRIYEGKQARNRNITIVGNTKTSDHVILREIYTKPGDLFSRDAVIRTQRQLAQNGYFDPEKLAVNPKPNPADGTVDIEYVVEEKPSDQIELSGGWG
ncbi:outer membrane protein assembly factor BamA, partial [Flavobacteriales bacterium]|nr:outer membrane protein assembly factor BamA [Flavobacteriales bacterium]